MQAVAFIIFILATHENSNTFDIQDSKKCLIRVNSTCFCLVFGMWLLEIGDSICGSCYAIGQRWSVPSC